MGRALVLLSLAGAAGAAAYYLLDEDGGVTGGDQLSPHFHLSQFTQWMGRLAPPREVPPDVRANLVLVAQQLEVVRAELGGVTLRMGQRSGWRPLDIADPGVSPGPHTWGQAADFWTDAYTPWQVRDAVERLIRQGRIRQGGVGVYDSPGSRFVHYDIRGTPARWFGESTPAIPYDGVS